MESPRDFIQCLGHDLSLRILLSLENPSDLICFSAVCTSWHGFAITNSLCKQLCLKKNPELASVSHVIGENNSTQLVDSCNSMKNNILTREHKIYAYLAQGLAISTTNMCISDAISASSTGNYPEESIQNTLEPRDIVGVRPSYWSSMGQTRPAISEKLIYKLISRLCIVTEIHVQSSQACTQDGFPIHSPRDVQFRMGYPKSPMEFDYNGKYKFEDSKKYNSKAFLWTYISPVFPVAQKNGLQTFMLPEPVLCIGGILQIELLGRVQSQETENVYLRVTYVQVVGRPLSPGFDVQVLDSSGRYTLNYYPGMKFRCYPINGKAITCKYSSFSSMFSNGSVVIPFLFIAFICFLLPCRSSIQNT